MKIPQCIFQTTQAGDPTQTQKPPVVVVDPLNKEGFVLYIKGFSRLHSRVAGIDGTMTIHYMQSLLINISNNLNTLIQNSCLITLF